LSKDESQSVALDEQKKKIKIDKKFEEFSESSESISDASNTSNFIPPNTK
jgi:hypothetical protein